MEKSSEHDLLLSMTNTSYKLGRQVRRDMAKLEKKLAKRDKVSKKVSPIRVLN